MLLLLFLINFYSQKLIVLSQINFLLFSRDYLQGMSEWPPNMSGYNFDQSNAHDYCDIDASYDGSHYYGEISALLHIDIFLSSLPTCHHDLPFHFKLFVFSFIYIYFYLICVGGFNLWPFSF